MKYPLIDQNRDYPGGPICPICKKNRVFEPHNFVCVDGGAFYLSKKGDSIFPKSPEKMEGFLNVTFHGHHYEDIEDENKDIFETLDIVKESADGQFSLYFCSPKCLREFFNQLVDEFEKRIEKARRSNG